MVSEARNNEADTFEPVLSVHSVGTSRIVNPARLAETSRFTSKARSAIRREEWILSTTARRSALHGHCVSLMCIQNKPSTTRWKQRLLEPAMHGGCAGNTD